MNFIISKETLQALLNYLGNRPYIDVSKLINALTNLKQLPADSKEKNESAKKEQ